MTSANLILRAAGPTLVEGRLFAHYLDTAAEGFFDFMLGRRKAHIVADAYLETGHDLSHEHATFAESYGVIRGMVTGYTGEQHRRSSAKVLDRAAGPRHLRYRAISTLSAPLKRVMDNLADDDFYVLALAVDAAARGQGAGARLLAHAEDHARAVGARRLALDVAGGNASARGIYEHLGWKVEYRWPGRLAPPALALDRMTKPL